MNAKPLLRSLSNAAIALPGLHALLRFSGRCGLLPQRIWSGYPLDGTFTLQAGGVSFRYRISPGDYVGMPLYWLGEAGYEPETFARFGEFLGKADVFYDIGANTGLFAIVAALLRPVLRVIAVEPNPQTFQRLCENIALNGLEERVTPVHAAISADDGEITLHIPEGVFALSSTLAPEGSADALPGHRAVRVPGLKLDSLAAHHGAPGAIKIDAEGHEAAILESAATMLTASQPPLLLEILDDADFARLEAALHPLGYRFARLGEYAPDWRAHLGPRGQCEGRNVWCATFGW